MMNVSERSVTICECFRIPIGICLKASFQFVFRLIFGYVSSFFFKVIDILYCVSFILLQIAIFSVTILLLIFIIFYRKVLYLLILFIFLYIWLLYYFL